MGIMPNIGGCIISIRHRRRRRIIVNLQRGVLVSRC